MPTYNPIAEEALDLQYRLKELGIILDIPTGHLFYDPQFKPIQLGFELAFARHGETYGNCGQTTKAGTIDHDLVKLEVKDKERRVYQGDVDAEINQLTATGKQQAEDLATRLETELLAKNWQPSIILFSPLSRAKNTGIPFVEKTGLTKHYFPCHDIKEMKFGAWENRRICDLEFENPCHLFYLTNHALVKSNGVDAHGIYQVGECFAEVILRAHKSLRLLEQDLSSEKVLMFSHSMFGAACRILFGKGQTAENDNFLAFDGKRRDGSSYALPFATPFLLNFELT